MRLLALFTAALFACTLVAADDKKDEKKSKDDESIVGTWRAEKVETGDEQADKTFLSTLKLTVTFDKEGRVARLTTRADDTPLLGKADDARPAGFKLDPSKTPKTIDVGSGTTGDLAGIYELDGDTLKLCLAKTVGTARPTEFKGDKDKHTMMTLKREKGEKKDK